MIDEIIKTYEIHINTIKEILHEILSEMFESGEVLNLNKQIINNFRIEKISTLSRSNDYFCEVIYYEPLIHTPEKTYNNYRKFSKTVIVEYDRLKPKLRSIKLNKLGIE